MADALAEAFERFETAGREAQEMIEATPRFRDPDHRAQAYVSLAEARAMAYNMVVAPRLDHPHVHGQTSWNSTFFSLGQNCQDFRYGALLLDGRQTYRLSGRVGDTKLILIQVHSHVLGHPDAEEIGDHDLVDLAGSDGTFEATLGAGDPDGNRIPLNGDSLNFLFVRRILTAIDDDPGELLVERIDGPAPEPETDPEAIAERLDLAAHLLRFLVRDWCVDLHDMYIKAAGGKNRLAHVAGKDLASSAGGSPSTTYDFGIFELEPDQALIIECEPPESAYWSFQLGDVWSNALDFSNYQTDLNMRTGVIDGDGRFRAVVCERDPGIANWMDTRGRREGSLVMRNYRERGESTPPAVWLVRWDDLAEELPDDTRRVSSEERERSLADRRAAYRAAYGE